MVVSNFNLDINNTIDSSDNDLDFFLLSNNNVDNSIKLSIHDRKLRVYKGINDSESLFNAGDVVVVVYWKEAIVHRFEGLCLFVKKRSLVSTNVSLLLRNVIDGVGIELIVSYYINRVYNYTLSDYKRKDFMYRKAKLYHVRSLVNRASRVS